MRDGGEVAVPDRLPRGWVGRADGDDVVESAVPQERAVQGAYRVRGTDEQPLILLRNGGMSLSISFVTPCAAETVRGWRIPAISSTSSMNSTTLSSSATRENASRKADARPA